MMSLYPQVIQLYFGFLTTKTEHFEYLIILKMCSKEKSLKGRVTMRPDNHHIRFDFLLKIEDFSYMDFLEKLRFDLHFFRFGKLSDLFCKILFALFSPFLPGFFSGRPTYNHELKNIR